MGSPLLLLTLLLAPFVSTFTANTLPVDFLHNPPGQHFNATWDASDPSVNGATELNVVKCHDLYGRTDIYGLCKYYLMPNNTMVALYVNFLADPLLSLYYTPDIERPYSVTSVNYTVLYGLTTVLRFIPIRIIPIYKPPINESLNYYYTIYQFVTGPTDSQEFWDDVRSAETVNIKQIAFEHSMTLIEDKLTDINTLATETVLDTLYTLQRAQTGLNNVNGLLPIGSNQLYFQGSADEVEQMQPTYILELQKHTYKLGNEDIYSIKTVHLPDVAVTGEFISIPMNPSLSYPLYTTILQYYTFTVNQTHAEMSRKNTMIGKDLFFRYDNTSGFSTAEFETFHINQLSTGHVKNFTVIKNYTENSTGRKLLFTEDYSEAFEVAFYLKMDLADAGILAIFGETELYTMDRVISLEEIEQNSSHLIYPLFYDTVDFENFFERFDHVDNPKNSTKEFEAKNGIIQFFKPNFVDYTTLEIIVDIAKNDMLSAYYSYDLFHITAVTASVADSTTYANRHFIKSDTVPAATLKSCYDFVHDSTSRTMRLEPLEIGVTCLFTAQFAAAHQFSLFLNVSVHPSSTIDASSGSTNLLRVTDATRNATRAASYANMQPVLVATSQETLIGDTFDLSARGDEGSTTDVGDVDLVSKDDNIILFDDMMANVLRYSYIIGMENLSAYDHVLSESFYRVSEVTSNFSKAMAEFSNHLKFLRYNSPEETLVTDSFNIVYNENDEELALKSKNDNQFTIFNGELTENQDVTFFICAKKSTLVSNFFGEDYYKILHLYSSPNTTELCDLYGFFLSSSGNEALMRDNFVVSKRNDSNEVLTKVISQNSIYFTEDFQKTKRIRFFANLNQTNGGSIDKIQRYEPEESSGTQNLRTQTTEVIPVEENSETYNVIVTDYNLGYYFIELDITQDSSSRGCLLVFDNTTDQFSYSGCTIEESKKRTWLTPLIVSTVVFGSIIITLMIILVSMKS